jgi:hypothetical protein
MDILNFISWIRGGRVVNSVDPAKTLLPVGLKDNRRDDGYLAGAISVEDFTNQVKPYKVYTALLTQSGGDNPLALYSQNTPSLTIGVTYQIDDDGGSGWDFTNVGAPNNDLFTYFVATGTTPASWGTNGMLRYNTGAPVVTVLENTIGNVWFTYSNDGEYNINTSSIFGTDKVFTLVTNNIDVFDFGGFHSISLLPVSTSQIFLATGNIDGHYNDILNDTPIEIRVYN